MDREPGRVDRHRENSGNDDVRDSRDAALCWDAVFEGEAAGVIVHSAGEHQTQGSLDGTNRKHWLARDRVYPSVCQTRRHDALYFRRDLKEEL